MGSLIKNLSILNLGETNFIGGKIIFTKMQVAWIRYRSLYKRYREAKSKDERREIRALILKENHKKLS